jgi:hypothetical protein
VTAGRAGASGPAAFPAPCTTCCSTSRSSPRRWPSSRSRRCRVGSVDSLRRCQRSTTARSGGRSGPSRGSTAVSRVPDGPLPIGSVHRTGSAASPRGFHAYSRGRRQWACPRTRPTHRANHRRPNRRLNRPASRRRRCDTRSCVGLRLAGILCSPSCNGPPALATTVHRSGLAASCGGRLY